ncbi:MAG: hypothetical protein JRE10_15110 [Deltaproteobacteria bacterium]|nr:hypothetical protein [Deltaproteobacteria bacterium]
MCFPSSSSEKLICGKVLRTSASSAVVRVKKREAKKIEIGAEAALYVGNEDEK